MSQIVFDFEPEGTPYDRDEQLTAWRLVGSSTYPTAISGARFAARTFDGTSGYEAEDAASALQGLGSIAWRILCRPDYDALAGTTVTLIARGSGGPTTGDYWPWEVQLTVNGGATQATVTLAWQDGAGATVTHDLGTYDRPAPGSWTLVAVTREPVESGTYLRLVVDGVPFPELAVADLWTATPDEVVTLGCRNNAGAYEQFFIGDIELAWVELEAATPLQERHAYHALLVHPPEDRETIRRYLIGLDEVIPTRGSVYDKARIRPLSELLTTVSEAVETRADAALPDNAYGPRLREWETTLALTDATSLSVAERQVRAAAALGKIEGLSLAFQEGHATEILETGDPLASFRRVTRIDPDVLWMGTATDLVSGYVLTATGVAYEAEDVPNVALSCPWGRRALSMGHGLDNEWTTPNATIGNMTSAEPVVVVLGYVLRHFRAGIASLIAGNRGTATLIGWQIEISTAGQIRTILDDGPNQTIVSLGAGSASLNTPHVLLIAFDGATVRSATELTTASGAFAFDPTSSTPAGLGAYRTTSPEVTANWDCLFWAFFRGAAKHAAVVANTQGFCQALRAPLVSGA